MKTGWPPGLLQDDDRKLSKWFAGRPDARYQLRKHMKEDITRMAREAGIKNDCDGVWCTADDLEAFAALVRADERNKVAQWMMAQGYATGHGDTTEDLLEELDWQITESWSKVVMASVEAEREACAKAAGIALLGADRMLAARVQNAISARGQA